jgi:diguanylate cyclase (GGDEF)-like protein
VSGPQDVLPNTDPAVRRDPMGTVRTGPRRAERATPDPPLPKGTGLLAEDCPPEDPEGFCGPEWVVRAQDGHAEEVLAEIDNVLCGNPEPVTRGWALYAQAIALSVMDDTGPALASARALCALCHDLGLPAAGLRARALLVDLLRRDGRPEEAVVQLAHAVAMEPLLENVHDREVQLALAALAVALRLSGVTAEAGRIEARLAPVEPRLPRHLRVSRCSNLAFEQANTALAAHRAGAREPDVPMLRLAVAEIGRAEQLAAEGSYGVVRDEAAVLRALLDSVDGDPTDALGELRRCEHVLRRGAEAVPAQLFWAVGRVRALRRAGRAEQAVQEGRLLLETHRGRAETTRLALAHEVMQAEEEHAGTVLHGARAYLEQAEERLRRDVDLLIALFQARVDLLRAAEERRSLARAASLDSLTGLMNRRAAGGAVAQAAALAPGEPLALLLVDLDGFGEINDEHGHLAGDVVLQRVACALAAAAGPARMVARWGGDEFVVLVRADTAQAVCLAERVRDAIRDSAEPGAVDGVTSSVGVSVRTEPIDQDVWMRRADVAMYAAKRSGGNATVLG